MIWICPILTDAHAENTPPQTVHFRRILGAIDLSDASGRVLRWVRDLASEYDALPALVHSIGSGEVTTRLFADFQRQVASLQSEAGSCGPAFIEPGDASEVVIRKGAEFGADLLIIGKHNGGPASRYLNQSAYSIISGSPCPVLSV